MAYAEKNFLSKKELREALDSGEKVRVFQPGLGEVPANGTVFLEGPHFPEPHTWYGEGKMVEGFLDEIK